ncbi:MAG: hypothetical protein MUO40_07630 [Anaerolineaceae bacterium]|nr:hypothetical protein [Anaerolineaceae bacterium]
MHKWEYAVIRREIDFTGYDTMLLGPGYGPSHVWTGPQKIELDKYATEQEQLDQLGEKGWELISVERDQEVGRK